MNIWYKQTNKDISCVDVSVIGWSNEFICRALFSEVKHASSI